MLPLRNHHVHKFTFIFFHFHTPCSIIEGKKNDREMSEMNMKTNILTILAILAFTLLLCRAACADYGFTPSAKSDYGCTQSQKTDYGFVPASEPSTQGQFSTVSSPGGYPCSAYPNSYQDYYPPYYFNNDGNRRPCNSAQAPQQPKSVTDPQWVRQQTTVTDSAWQRQQQQNTVTNFRR
jgi:hypothetical protein